MDNGKRINVFPVVATIPADLLTPLAVYLKLSANSTHSFLLESVEGGRSLARYSFIGADPHLVARTAGSGTELTDHSGTRAIDTHFFTYLREHFTQFSAETDHELPAFIGGAIGYLGFDCCEWFEPKLAGGGEPDAAMMFFRSIVAFDHAKQVVKIISLVFENEITPELSRDDLISSAKKRNEDLRRCLEQDPVIVPPNYPGDGGKPTSNWEQPQFEDAVSEIIELINAGECYQVVLSQCFSRPTNAHPVSIYRALRTINPSPYMFLLKIGEKAVIGASPELLVRCEGTRLAYRPIAGTRRRGGTHEEDRALAEEMQADKKEVAEHLMLVDLGRNDLGRVSEYGSVKVDALMIVEKYSHVQHLVSALSSKLAVDKDRFDALASCFPAGTVSGAPKVRAIEIIRSLEPETRRTYAGAAGYFDYAGNMDTCIAIRTLCLERGVARIQAGGGIVADSVPALEFDESVNKAKVLLKAISQAES